MFKSGFVLSSGAHLKAAQFNRTPVEVWQHGQLLEYGGPIEKITGQAVWINGNGYLRAVCEFKVR